MTTELLFKIVNDGNQIQIKNPEQDAAIRVDLQSQLYELLSSEEGLERIFFNIVKESFQEKNYPFDKGNSFHFIDQSPLSDFNKILADITERVESLETDSFDVLLEQLEPKL